MRLNDLTFCFGKLLFFLNIFCVLFWSIQKVFLPLWSHNNDNVLFLLKGKTKQNNIHYDRNKERRLEGRV